MKICIAYDGSAHAERAIRDLVNAGLPEYVEAVVATSADVTVIREPVKVGATAIERASRTHEHLGRHARKAVDEARNLAQQGAVYTRALYPSWQVSAETLTGSPGWEILEFVAREDMDMVVAGSRGHGAFMRFVLGSVSQRLVHYATCAVRVVHENITSRLEPPKMVVGYDASPGAQGAIQALSERVWPAGTEVRLVSAIEPVVPSPSGFLVPTLSERLQAYNRDIAAHTRVMLKDVAARLARPGLQVDTLVEIGDPSRVLLDAAEDWGAEAIFVGAGGRGRLGRFITGSVSSAVAASAHCVVEVIHTRV